MRVHVTGPFCVVSALNINFPRHKIHFRNVDLYTVLYFVSHVIFTYFTISIQTNNKQQQKHHLIYFFFELDEDHISFYGHFYAEIWLIPDSSHHFVPFCLMKWSVMLCSGLRPVPYHQKMSSVGEGNERTLRTDESTNPPNILRPTTNTIGESVAGLISLFGTTWRSE